ncbi:MAG: Ppx/GppA family phosphatase [Proteobacteria bacterium]|nr:Ppx/GppA family phosphatase [Pseudomonadota bacterium]
MKLASIDIGTNTLRLLIGSVDSTGQITDSLLRREITRLGGGFDGKELHPEAKRRTLDTLSRFAGTLKENGVTMVAASATSVVREAEDGSAFIDEIFEKTGITVDLIPGEREASLTLKGVLSALEGGREKQSLIFDIGGGSTEFIAADKGELTGLKSLNMGVVAITEKFLHSDPPSPADISTIKKKVDAFMAEYIAALPPIVADGGTLLVGTAGTVTSLAALDQDLAVYDSRKINNYRMSRESIERLFERLKVMTHNERAALGALEDGRADLIIPGTIIVLMAMSTFGFDELLVSDYGLLEGLLIDLAEREGLL